MILQKLGGIQDVVLRRTLKRTLWKNISLLHKTKHFNQYTLLHKMWSGTHSQNWQGLLLMQHNMLGWDFICHSDEEPASFYLVFMVSFPPLVLFALVHTHTLHCAFHTSAEVQTLQNICIEEMVQGSQGGAAAPLSYKQKTSWQLKYNVRSIVWIIITFNPIVSSLYFNWVTKFELFSIISLSP